ncbi:MAG TPA: gliding motility-associated C-terminal domain-containing protein [Flavipsychrobacter sp.]|nr:gliding motility-associated C-terminal domain-containing protein [Flavipsychrobacter sp.]
MTKKCTQFLLVCLTLLFSFSESRATHAAGGELVYQWLSGSTYRFYFKFYKDCAPGSASEPASLPFCYYNSCNSTTGNVTAPKMSMLPGNLPNGQPVSLGCPGFPTTCDGGALPGYREWWYSADITFPSQCNFWTIYCGINARNTAIDNLGPGPGSYTLFVKATLDNLNAQGNSSPTFTIKPVPYTCANTPFTYNNGVVDPDGDSLSFELAFPLNGPGQTCQNPPNITNIDYAPTAGVDNYDNVDNPFNTNNTFTLNTFTGQMSFTPAVQSENVVSIKVHEYRNGQEIGTVIRDIQTIIRVCNVPPPQVVVDANSVYVGTYVNGQIEGCAGQPMHFCFDAVTVADRILVVDDNHEFIDNNISVVYTNQATDTVTGCVDWLPGFADTGLHIFVITVKDSTCEPPGIPITNTFTIPLHVWPATEVLILGPDTICPLEPVPLVAIGGANYQWDVLPGGSPITSMSCTACDNPMVTPTVTTTYVVTSTINTYCDLNRDTITITVRQPPVFDLGPDIITCVNNPVQLNTNLVPYPGQTYAVQWDPPTWLDDPTSNTPWMDAFADVTYIVTIIPDGFVPCQTKDTLNVTVLQGFDVFNGDTAICMGDTVQVNATGDTRYTYSWTPVTGVSDPSIFNPFIVPDTTHTYVVTATYPGCRDSIQLFTIDAQPVPIVDAGPPEMTVCLGSRTQLNATYTPFGYPYYTLLWTPGSSLTASDAADPVFIAFDTVMLHFVVSTPVGCKGEDSILMNVNPSDFLDISADQVICPRDTVQLHVSGDGSTTLISVNWTEDFHYVSDASSLDPYVSPITTTTFTVIGTDHIGCTDTVSTEIIVKAEAIVNLPDSAVIYPGETYQLDPGGNCLYFTWFPPSGLSDDQIANPVAAPEVNTRYYVDAAAENGCATRDSIDIILAPDSYIDVPNAFTPGAAPNAIFKVVYKGNATLKKFVVYNRWGVKMYETSNITEGWDGTYNGKAQPMGVYVYTVEAVSSTGKRLVKQGNVTLIR